MRSFAVFGILAFVVTCSCQKYQGQQGRPGHDFFNQRDYPQRDHQEQQRNHQAQNFQPNYNNQQRPNYPSNQNQQRNYNQQQQQNLNPSNHKDDNKHRDYETTTQPNAYRPPPIPIISFNKQQSIDGSYKTSYETGNNIIAEETGFLKNVGVKDEEALVQHGSYSYTDPDGNVITVTYTADEGGFRPQGDHLPTPPPVPAEVQRGLDIIFEQIRLDAEKAAKEKQYENTKQESANYPNDFHQGNRKYRR